MPAHHGWYPFTTTQSYAIVPRDFDEIEPFAFLPVQADGGRPLAPEQRLCLAILDDALAAAIGTRRGYTTRRDRAQAWKWIMSSSIAHIFTFVNVCGALGLTPECVRRRALAAPRDSYVRVIAFAGSAVQPQERRSHRAGAEA